MNKEQIELGLRTGLELIGPNSDLKLTMKQLDGVVMLRHFLSSIMQGHLHIVVNPNAGLQEQPQAPAEPVPEPKPKAKAKKAT